jgi:hypothetical protein
LGAAFVVDDEDAAEEVEESTVMGAGGRGERPDLLGAVAVPVEEPVREVAVGPDEVLDLGLEEEGETGLGLGWAYLGKSERGSEMSWTRGQARRKRK